ncbi:alpha/beta fold hydrolase [Halobellus rufus]|uniref:alpha/beta fold hydrolase n=1 Tax=Halobellus rufus TaxID=1448860 RepID=UPI000678D559|nr:alpha/beta hydrolase [Halobellus rufus]
MPTVRTNGIETYYERRGEGPPIVFVHGAVVDHGQWLPQAEALSDAYTIVVYDLRGHGRTGGSPIERYTFDLFVEDLDALLDALDLSDPVLCGLSLGGCIAQAYATSYPDRLSGLVLADTFTSGDWRWPERLQWALLGATIPFARLFGYQRIERAMVWAQERVRGDEASGDYEAIRELRATGPTMSTEEFAKVIRALRAVPEMRVDFTALSVPTLILYGEHEMGFVRRHAADLAAQIDDASVLEVPGGAHASNLDKPAFVTAALRRFLAERVVSER